MSYFYLGIAIVAEIIATSLLKTSEGFTRLIPTIILGIGLNYFSRVVSGAGSIR